MPTKFPPAEGKVLRRYGMLTPSSKLSRGAIAVLSTNCLRACLGCRGDGFVSKNIWHQGNQLSLQLYFIMYAFEGEQHESEQIKIQVGFEILYKYQGIPTNHRMVYV
jgi:hypothetical protein